MAQANGGNVKNEQLKKAGIKPKVTQSEDRAETPKLLPIQRLEQLVNQCLMQDGITMMEAIGFFELKLIEMKESWRQQVGLNMIKMQASTNETKN